MRRIYRVAACNHTAPLVFLSLKQSPCLMLSGVIGFLMRKLFVIMKLKNVQNVAFAYFSGTESVLD